MEAKSGEESTGEEGGNILAFQNEDIGTWPECGCPEEYGVLEGAQGSGHQSPTLSQRIHVPRKLTLGGLGSGTILSRPPEAGLWGRTRISFPLNVST